MKQEMNTDLPLVEIGWLVAGKLEEVVFCAPRRATQSVTEELEAQP